MRDSTPDNKIWAMIIVGLASLAWLLAATSMGAWPALALLSSAALCLLVPLRSSRAGATREDADALKACAAQANLLSLSAMVESATLGRNEPARAALASRSQQAAEQANRLVGKRAAALRGGRGMSSADAERLARAARELEHYRAQLGAS